MEATVIKITEQMVECGMLTPAGMYSYIAEASTLGFPPGCWANKIETDLGNKHPFLIKDDRREEVKIYKQEFGCIELHVLND